MARLAGAGRQLAIDVATGNGQAAVALAHTSTSDRDRALRRAAARGASASARRIPAGSGGVDLGRGGRGRPRSPRRRPHTGSTGRASAPKLRACFARAASLRSGATATATSLPAIDRLVGDFSRDVVGPYWPRERRHVDEAYRDLVLPFPPIDAPDFEMQTRWDAAAMLGYLDTWSAVRRCRARTGATRFACWPQPLTASLGRRNAGHALAADSSGWSRLSHGWSRAGTRCRHRCPIIRALPDWRSGMSLRKLLPAFLCLSFAGAALADNAAAPLASGIDPAAHGQECAAAG